MKKLSIILGSIGLIVLVCFISFLFIYNNAISYQESVEEKWSNVQSAYQRRADLLPQLVETVKNASKNEKDILMQVTNARSGIVNSKTPEDLENAGKQINTAINLAFEAYPKIRSTENFIILQAQLEGSENRINRERDLYNEAVKEYNTHIRSFFARIVLNSEKFPKEIGFKANNGSENPPKIEY